ncbi:hypothetical protein D3C75_877310 [compost metagenome]
MVAVEAIAASRHGDHYLVILAVAEDVSEHENGLVEAACRDDAVIPGELQNRFARTDRAGFHQQKFEYSRLCARQC